MPRRARPPARPSRRGVFFFLNAREGSCLRRRGRARVPTSRPAKHQRHARAAPQGRKPVSLGMASADEMVYKAKECGTGWYRGHIAGLEALVIMDEDKARQPARRPPKGHAAAG